MAHKSPLKWYSSGPNASFGYDPNGRIIKFEGGQGREYTVRVYRHDIHDTQWRWAVDKLLATETCDYTERQTLAEGMVGFSGRENAKVARVEAKAAAEKAYEKLTYEVPTATVFESAIQNIEKCREALEKGEFQVAFMYVDSLRDNHVKRIAETVKRLNLAAKAGRES